MTIIHRILCHRIHSNFLFNTSRYNDNRNFNVLKRSISFEIFKSITAIGSYGFTVESIQNYVIYVNATTSLPWWLSIGAATVFYRLCFFPVLVYHVKRVKLLSKAMPQIFTLVQLYNKNTNNPKNFSHNLELFRVLLSGIQASLTINKASISSLLLYPFVNICSQILYYDSMSLFIKGSKSDELAVGGFGWFSDLTTYDSTMILPLTGATVLYCTIWYVHRNAKTGTIYIYFVDIIQSMTILFLPVYIYLPSLQLCWFIPSYLTTIFQIAIINDSRFKKLVNI